MIWRDIVGFEGLYMISDTGIVKSVKNGRLHKFSIAGSEYPRATLWKNGKMYTRRIHRLVAEAFLGPCPIGLEVRHHDGNRFNPVLSNLSYSTRKENHSDKIIHGTHNKGSRHSLAKLDEENVVLIRSRFKSGETQTSIAKSYNVSRPAIGYIVRGETWTHVRMH